MKFWHLSMLAVLFSTPLTLAQDKASQQLTPPSETASAKTAPAEETDKETKDNPAEKARGDEAADADQTDPADVPAEAENGRPREESNPADAVTNTSDAANESAENEAAEAEGRDDGEEAAADREPDASPLQTQRQKTSYAVGVSIGRGLKQDGADLDAALVAEGLTDSFLGGRIRLSDQQIRAQIVTLQKQLRGQAAAEPPENEAAGDVQAAAAAFLEENKKKEGVVTLPSGLQYQVLKEGEGDKPQATDTVRVHYRGTLIDGTEFDSSLEGEPGEFRLDGVIPGWTEGLQLMPVGSKWKLFIPANLGYGDNPRANGEIRPGDALIFEVELLQIKK